MKNEKNQTAPGPKKFTAQGKPVSRFTMIVEFKKEFQRVNPTTGEVKQGWTYRADLENAKFAKLKDNQAYAREVDVLGYIFKRDRRKYHTVKFYDNYQEPGKQLFGELIEDKLVYPLDQARKEKFNTWVNKTV